MVPLPFLPSQLPLNFRRKGTFRNFKKGQENYTFTSINREFRIHARLLKLEIEWVVSDR